MSTRTMILLATLLLTPGCSNSGPTSGVEGSKTMTEAGAADLQALCVWAESQLASTKGTACDVAIEDGVSGCVTSLQEQAAQQPACAAASIAALETCINHMKSHPCLEDEQAKLAACGAAEPCIGLGEKKDPGGPTTQTGIPYGTTAASLSDEDLGKLCQHISGTWSSTAQTACDISFPTVAACTQRLVDRRASGSCAAARIEQLESCAQQMLADSCLEDLTTLNQVCGDAIDCLIPRG